MHIIHITFLAYRRPTYQDHSQLTEESEETAFIKLKNTYAFFNRYKSQKCKQERVVEYMLHYF